MKKAVTEHFAWENDFRSEPGAVEARWNCHAYIPPEPRTEPARRAFAPHVQ